MIESPSRQVFVGFFPSLPFGCLLFLLSLFQVACTDKEIASKKITPPLVTGVEVGNLAPDFNVANLKGGRASLSDYRGRIVLVNFWATWCGPCKAEMPSMEALYRSHERDDFEILAVSIDLGDEAPVRAFVDDFGFTFPILLDSQFDVNDLFQVRVVPTSIVIDRNGVVTDRLLGAKDWNDPDAQKFVKELIGRPHEEISRSGAAERTKMGTKS